MICTGEYRVPSHDEKPNPFPIQALVSALCFIIYFLLTISIHVRKYQIEIKDSTYLQVKNGTIPKSLESLLLNFGIVGIIFVTYVCHVQLDR